MKETLRLEPAGAAAARQRLRALAAAHAARAFARL